MLDTWVSDIVVGLFALLFGADTALVAVLSRPWKRDVLARETERMRAGREDHDSMEPPVEPPSLADVFRRERAEGRRLAMPRSLMLASLAVYGLIAVTVATIIYSPVEMRWIAFFIGFVIGYALVQGVFHAGKRAGTASSAGDIPLASNEG